jgi:hypothetical protein
MIDQGLAYDGLLATAAVSHWRGEVSHWPGTARQGSVVSHATKIFDHGAIGHGVPDDGRH